MVEQITNKGQLNFTIFLPSRPNDVGQPSL